MCATVPAMLGNTLVDAVGCRQGRANRVSRVRPINTSVVAAVFLLGYARIVLHARRASISVAALAIPAESARHATIRAQVVRIDATVEDPRLELVPPAQH
jgi:hypothetical protein